MIMIQRQTHTEIIENLIRKYYECPDFRDMIGKGIRKK
jgi:hypothetical protein